MCICSGRPFSDPSGSKSGARARAAPMQPGSAQRSGAPRPTAFRAWWWSMGGWGNGVLRAPWTGRTALAACWKRKRPLGAVTPEPGVPKAEVRLMEEAATGCSQSLVRQKLLRGHSGLSSRSSALPSSYLLFVLQRLPSPYYTLAVEVRASPGDICPCDGPSH